MIDFAEWFLAMEGRPVPEVAPENAAFFAGCAEGRLLIQQCRTCGHRQHYPRGGCTLCAAEVDWIESSGRGIVHTFTVVRYTRDTPFDRLTPFVVAIIDLEEGVRMLSNVLTRTPEEIEIGMPVTVHFAEATRGCGVFIPFFKPA